MFLDFYLYYICYIFIYMYQIYKDFEGRGDQTLITLIKQVAYLWLY